MTWNGTWKSILPATPLRARRLTMHGIAEIPVEGIATPVKCSIWSNGRGLTFAQPVAVADVRWFQLIRP
jgi:hypothetical protein